MCWESKPAVWSHYSKVNMAMATFCVCYQAQLPRFVSRSNNYFFLQKNTKCHEIWGSHWNHGWNWLQISSGIAVYRKQMIICLWDFGFRIKNTYRAMNMQSPWYSEINGYSWVLWYSWNGRFQTFPSTVFSEADLSGISNHIKICYNNL